MSRVFFDPRSRRTWLVDVDQYVRGEVDQVGSDSSARKEIAHRVIAVDMEDTARVRMLIQRCGWMTISGFGEDADEAAWLLVQHADEDREFQKQALKLMKDELAKHETSAKHYAYLVDRVAVAEGNPQLYGTQGRCVGAWKWEPDTIDDDASIDERRATVGLKSIAEYRAHMSEKCTEGDQ